MKKIFNRVLFCGLMACVCAMFASCLVLVDDPANHPGYEVTVETKPYEKQYATVSVENMCGKYGPDANYIMEVYCRTYSTDDWTLCWDSSDYSNPLYADRDCSFKLDEGRYYFCVRIVYPNMSKVYDYYDDFYTEGRYYCYSGYTTKLVFDGEYLYKN